MTPSAAPPSRVWTLGPWSHQPLEIRLLVASLWILLALESGRILRTFVGIDPIHVSLALGRLFDGIFILIWLGRLARKPSLSLPSLIVVMVCGYPVLTALATGTPHLRTFGNDLILYIGLVAKVEVLRTVLVDSHVRAYLTAFIRRYAITATAIAVAAVAAVYVLGFQAIGVFQVQIDLTPAFGFAAAVGGTGWLIFLAALAAAAGKRMFVLGAIVLLGLSLLEVDRRRLRAYLAIAALVVTAVFARDLVLRAGDLDGVRRTVETVQVVGESYPTGFLQLAELADPVRYSEARSVIAELSDRNGWLLGLGYGFRYEIHPSFLSSDVATLQGERTHTNSHLTPLGIVLKFGLVGLIVWMLFAGRCLALLSRERDDTPDGVLLRRFAWFTLVAYLAESMVAYLFFVAPFVPVVLALGLASRSPRNEGRSMPVLSEAV